MRGLTGGPAGAGFDEAIPRLVELGLIDAEKIVAGDVKVAGATRRNRNLRLAGRGNTYLVKLPEPTNPETRRTLASEACFYAFCRAHPDAAHLHRILAPPGQPPPARGGSSVVVVEWLENASPLWRHYTESITDSLPEEPLAALGAALALLHRTLPIPGAGAASELAGLPDGPPFPRYLLRPEPAVLGHASPANLEICRRLQQEPTLADALDRALARWRRSAVIHGDIRHDNVLVRRLHDGIDVVLVDWESVRRGDPACDVGDVLRDALHLWVVGMPWETERPLAERTDDAEIPLAALRPSLRAFWRSYVDGATLDAPANTDFLQRAGGYCGARLIQTAWEESSRAERLASRQIFLLQLAAEFLADPGAAVRELLGREPGDEEQRTTA